MQSCTITSDNSIFYLYKARNLIGGFLLFCYLVFSRLFCLIYTFLLDFLANSKKMSYLCGVKQLAMTYQMNLAQQRNFDFFAFFSALYLVVSDILLTHTQALLAFNHPFFLPAYARAKRGVTLVNKGLLGVSFVRYFVSICELSRKQNKDVLSIDFTTKDTYNSLVIVCFLSLISWAGSDKTLSACRGGEGKRLRGLYNEFVRMYIIKGER